jgi:type IV secretory pathway TraG/TraD family ATPase VirD4
LNGIQKYSSFFLPVCIVLALAIIIYELSKQIQINKFFRFYNLRKELKQIRKEQQTIRKEINLADKTLIGTATGHRKVYTKDDGKHFLICGTTGCGKTVTLSNFLNTVFEKGYPALFVDGKGDISKGSVLEIVKQLNEKYGNKKTVYVVDMNDPENSDCYNPFKGTNATIVKDMLVNMTDWTEEHYKINTERYLQCVISLMIKANLTITLKEIIKYMPIEKFIKFSAELYRKDIITKEQHIENNEIAETSGKIASNSIARFSVMAESHIGQIFANQGIDIYTALKQNAIILFILDPLSYPELSPKLGRLILIDSKKAVSRLYRERMNRCFFLFDEINVYASTALLDLLNKSRSANVTCFCACQSLSDLDFAVNETFKWQVIENCNNYIVQRQNSSTNAENWANILGTRQTLDMTFQLEQKGRNTNETGYSSARRVREYLYHPDTIKSLKTGEAIYMSKDTNVHTKLNIHKPF